MFQEIFEKITKPSLNDWNSPVGKHLPPMATAFSSTSALRQRVTSIISSFKTYNQS